MNTRVGKQSTTATAEKLPEVQGALDQKTLDNLTTAMHGEAFAYVKYLLYADHARKSGNKELADLFEKTAHTERYEHLGVHFGEQGHERDRPDNRSWSRPDYWKVGGYRKSERSHSPRTCKPRALLSQWFCRDADRCRRLL